MTLDKRCLSPGCLVEPHFGFGSLLKGVMRWACAKHRGLLPSSSMAGRDPAIQPSSAVPAPSPTHGAGEGKAKQGVLL